MLFARVAKANILAISDLNPLDVWLKLWTMILCHVLPAMIVIIKCHCFYWSYAKQKDLFDEHT